MAQRNDGVAELLLGLIFGAGIGICIAGLATVVVLVFFPEYAPRLLLAGLN